MKKPIEKIKLITRTNGVLGEREYPVNSRTVRALEQHKREHVICAGKTYRKTI